MRKLIRSQWRMVVGLGIVSFLLFGTSLISGSLQTAHASSPIIYANALLSHTPTGSSNLQWNMQTKDLIVTLRLSGLAPDSRHPAHIHAGNCTSNGPVLYPLQDVLADASGNGTSITVLHAIADGILDNQWYINVHNGPGLATADQFLPIACGDIHNPHHWVKLNTYLGSTNAQNQAAYGLAHLTLSKGDLKIVLSVHGLVPGSIHAVHIHAGSCQSQLPGNIVYSLPSVRGDKHGNAMVSAIFHHVSSIPAHSWYINLHRSITLTTQTGFDPIACGNVTLA